MEHRSPLGTPAELTPLRARLENLPQYLRDESWKTAMPSSPATSPSLMFLGLPIFELPHIGTPRLVSNAPSSHPLDLSAFWRTRESLLKSVLTGT